MENLLSFLKDPGAAGGKRVTEHPALQDLQLDLQLDAGLLQRYAAEREAALQPRAEPSHKALRARPTPHAAKAATAPPAAAMVRQISSEVAPGVFVTQKQMTRSLSLQRQTTFAEDEDDALTAGRRPEPGTVLLTGATGFLGVFLLDMLLAQTTGTRVVCLVRVDGQQTPQERLRQHYVEAVQPAADQLAAFDQRVQAVAGTLGPLLGQTEAQFSEWAHTVDEICHCGALVNWGKDYSVAREPNVLATVELLRLAGTGHKAKPFTFVSTISAAGMTENDLLAPEAAIAAGPCSLRDKERTRGRMNE